ncbi:MAG: GlxA family transcriptional regulator [Geminicoccales bacterium]
MVNHSSKKHQFKVGLFLIDGFALMSYASVVEPLRAANLLNPSIMYNVINVPARGEAARSSFGVQVEASGKVGLDLDFDLLLVIAGGDPTTFRDQKVFNWLRRLDRMGVRLGGVSGGPVILAAAGLLEGRRITVHWEHADALAELAPDLMIERTLYVVDRDRVTCAGGTAPLDLMHALMAEHHGPDFARRVSDWFMHTDVRPSGGPQRAGLVERFRTTNQAVIDAIGFMENRIADPLCLDELAGFAGVSKRQLNRLFREKLGKTTMTFYRDLRLGKARSLLTSSSLPMTQIALATGFSSSAHFSKAHTERYGMPPSSVRAVPVALSSMDTPRIARGFFEF